MAYPAVRIKCPPVTVHASTRRIPFKLTAMLLSFTKTVKPKGEIVSIVKRMRSLQGVGILANRTTRDGGPEFRRYNLVYGFNGSGKSTLSRVFACLERGHHHDEMPEGSRFEVEMDDGTVYGSPENLQGVEGRICVFNTDFIERNLQWKAGRAASIFYISEQQAEAAAELERKQATLSARRETVAAELETARARARALSAHKTERARTISAALHVTGRRYEAPQLQSDYDNLTVDRTNILTEEALNDLEDVARQAAPPPPLDKVRDWSHELGRAIERARSFAALSLAQTAFEEIERHPTMVPWLKAGHEFHSRHDLETCLFCANPLSEERKLQLAAVLDDRLSGLMDELGGAQEAIRLAATGVMARDRWPAVVDLEGSLRIPFSGARDELEVVSKTAEEIAREAERITVERLAKPTLTVTHCLPNPAVVDAICADVRQKVAALNEIVDRHNAAVADFVNSQSSAREAIKKHYIAESFGEYASLKDEASKAQSVADAGAAEVAQLEADVVDLTAKVRAHGPAAEQITKLIQAYLGHGELTVFPADEGYELHRHGKVVNGSPSEGEKTAIALCYFLSTFEADGRDIKDLIIVIDDPISSLDTKAMNYASTLIRSRVEGAAQVFILTHNQHCMNEFKKGWKKREKATEDKPATAAFLFIDVCMPEQSDRREARLVELPRHLKGYDSEYHFLCSKVLQFEASGAGHFEYWFMMPNVIRRVLEVFLGFKEPGSHPIEQKLEALNERLPDLDPVRMKALERLVQVESHSDSMDDLISHSSMTVEETRDANSALLAFMAKADPRHTEVIRSQCKP